VQVVSTRKLDGPAAAPELRVAHEAPNPPHLVDEHGLPRILLQESPQFNAAALSVLEGPLATGIAGNSFFNPFIWDGLHYFSLTYDTEGRMSSGPGMERRQPGALYLVGRPPNRDQRFP